jgi:hypothetical protein
MFSDSLKSAKQVISNNFAQKRTEFNSRPSVRDNRYNFEMITNVG